MRNFFIVTLVILVVLGLFGKIYYDVSKKKETGEIPVTEQKVEVEKAAEVAPPQVVSNTVLPQYEDEYAKNDDLVGWISVPNTNIDYPVMQAVDNDFYLHRDFNKKELFDGIPFMDFRNILKPDLYDNTLVYGHNMGMKGTMFTELIRYQKLDFYKKSPTIKMDTIYQENQWKVIAAFEANTEAQFGEVFEYYNFVDAQTPEELQWYLDEIKKRSFYTTDVDVEFGDKLVTLQTCLNDSFETKFVVVARRVRPGESLEVDVNGAKINDTRVAVR